MQKRIFSLGLILLLLISTSLSAFADPAVDGSESVVVDTPKVEVPVEETTEPIVVTPIVEPPVANETESATEGQLLYNLGLISGTGAGNLAEDKTLTREEMVVILWRLSTNKVSKFVPPTTPTFTDVPVDHWAYVMIEEAYSLGLTSGISADTFGLGQTVTYQQAVAFLAKALGEKITWGSVMSEIKSKHGIYSVEGEKAPKLLRKHIFEMVVTALERKHVDGKLLLNKTDRLNKANKEAFTEKTKGRKHKEDKKAKPTRPEVVDVREGNNGIPYTLITFDASTPIYTFYFKMPVTEEVVQGGTPTWEYQVYLLEKKWYDTLNPLDDSYTALHALEREADGSLAYVKLPSISISEFNSIFGAR